MGENFRKFTIEMEWKQDGYRMWKHGAEEVTCFVESYKEKRSIYLGVVNLLPSAVLAEEQGGEYHLLLLGAAEGELLHRDFGVFRVNRRGQGSLFCKFTGPELECYSHCLLVAIKDGGAGAITVMEGVLPFCSTVNMESVEEEGDPAWAAALARWENLTDMESFTPDRDETGACWRRMEAGRENTWDLPSCLAGSSPLIEKYGHYLLGRRDDRYFVAIPGRFLRAEQPCREAGLFSLWQPVRGGEAFFDDLETLEGSLAEGIFGYWIGEVGPGGREIQPI